MYNLYFFRISHKREDGEIETSEIEIHDKIRVVDKIMDFITNNFHANIDEGWLTQEYAVSDSILNFLHRGMLLKASTYDQDSDATTDTTENKEWMSFMNNAAEFEALIGRLDELEVKNIITYFTISKTIIDA